MTRTSGSAHDEEVDLGAAWRALRRNRLLLGIGLVLGAAGGAAYAVLAPRSYEAQASLRIDPTRTSAVLERQDVRPEEARSELSTELEVLRSRTLVEDVVDSLALQLSVAEPEGVPRPILLRDVRVARDARRGELHLERIDGTRFRVTGTSTVLPVGQPVRVGAVSFALLPNAARFPSVDLQVEPHAATVDDVRKRTEVARPSPEANLVTVGFEDRDSLLVSMVPNAVVRRFTERRQQAQRLEAQSLATFLRNQIASVSGQLTQAEDELRTYREREQIANVEAESRAQIEAVTGLQGERDRLDAEERALRALLASTTTRTPSSVVEPSPYRRLVAFPTLLRNQSTSELLRALAEVENQRTELLIRRMPEDEDVQVLTGRIRQIEEQLRSVAVTYQTGLANQVGALDASIGRSRQQLERVPGREATVARLQRQPEVLGEVYGLLQTRLKEAEIAEAAVDPSVRLIDPAIPPQKPSSPNPPIDVVLGALLGLLLGLLAAGARELRRHLRTRAVRDSVAPDTVGSPQQRLTGAVRSAR